jgi:hypothetical protein
MRVDAAAVVAVHPVAAMLHAGLLASGMTLRPLARGTFTKHHRLRVSLVWRDRALAQSAVMTVTLSAARLESVL